MADERTWRDALRPIRMERVALVAPVTALRDMLVLVADAGMVELTVPPPTGRTRADGPEPEAQLREYAGAAVVHDGVAALAGWMPRVAVPALAGRLAPVGGAVVPLPRPPGVLAPSLLRRQGLRGSLAPLVETYTTVPYEDLDPTPLAFLAYVLMFGMMFGDAGHGLLVLAGAALLRFHPRLARFRRAWPFALGAGLTSIVFGLLYGEFFGPTGVLPVLWLEPLSHPIPLLLAALGAGAVLLAVAFVLGAINRWREGGWPSALYAPSGIAGAAVFAGLGLAAAGWYRHAGGLAWTGALVAACGLVLAFAGFLAEGGGGPSGVAQAAMRLFDVVVGLGSNLASFARLAAFGLMHAAIGWVVWQGATGLWGPAPLVAAGVFVAGNAVAFALEALVVGVQALRLEYYELFSRIFQAEGRPFRPWHLPTASGEDEACAPGSGAPS
ncbi:V-type ATPase 116kDa subunit family protein [Herbidospora yilanensis]|uniref:V-type ATPase 116kDa subunit family protein n=1 Tax=Herbidospora yilanensis TaxID=354426 RepID=UPI000AB88D4C|nr:V-type ATPase 116kDa subunit family protein [Herbidospora yilanensis]